MPGPRILLADDDQDLRGILAQRLAGDGYQVVQAPDGEAALEALKADPPDLAILDYHMPGLSGLEVCESLREDGAIFPVLLLTSTSERGVVDGALRSGVTAYILKPPRYEDLLAEIRRHLAAGEEGAPLPPRIVGILEHLNTLPALPLTTQKLLEVLNNPSAGAKELGRIITLDPAVTAQVLRLANSAYYGQTGKVSDVTKAVILIGFAEISHALMALSLSSLFAGKGAQGKEVLDREAFWEHALAVSVIAVHLAKRTGTVEANQAMVAGLLHDLGKLVMVQALPAEYAGILQQAAAQRRSAREVEREALGDNHTLLGELLAKRWQLPEPISRCIRYHHVPLSVENLDHVTVSLVRIVCAADALAKAAGLGFSGDDLVEEIPDRVWNLLSVDQGAAEEAVRAGRRAVALHKAALGMASPEAATEDGAVPVLHLLESDQPVTLTPFALESLGFSVRLTRSWGDGAQALEGETGESPIETVVLESQFAPKDSRFLDAALRWRKGRDRPGILFVAPGRRIKGLPAASCLAAYPKPMGRGGLKAVLDTVIS